MYIFIFYFDIPLFFSDRHFVTATMAHSSYDDNIEADDAVAVIHNPWSSMSEIHE